MEKIIHLIKLQNLWTTDAFDALIVSKIKSCLHDLETVGIQQTDNLDDPLIREAVLTYCTMNMGKPSSDEYERLKKAYDELKGQLQGTTGYGLE